MRQKVTNLLILAEFSIFNDFSEAKFKKEYEDIFEDKLEYRHEKLFGSRRESYRRKPKNYLEYSEKVIETLPVTVASVEEAPKK